MPAYIINGRELAKRRESLLRKKVSQFIELNRRRPSLLAIELSDDPGSRLYLKLKKAAAERIGIEFQVSGFRFQVSGFLDVDGVFIQHPPRQKLQEIAAQHVGGQAGLLKEQIDKFWQELADQIPPQKDVDCLTSTNLQLIKLGKPRFLPATVKAVIYCLKRTLLDIRQGESLKYAIRNKRIVILGRSPILGLPLSWYLKNLGAKVALLHSQTENNEQKTMSRKADILISSVGKPGIITGDMIKPGAIVIDCGSPSGDVAFGEVAPKASAITPVPGGVGPLTVVSLMENVAAAAEQQQN